MSRGSRPSARQAPLGVAQVEAAVDEDVRCREVARLRDQAVAAAAAGERGEAQQLTSAARAAARGCAARCCELSAAPSLLRTLTWLRRSPACVICTRYCSAFTLESLENQRVEEAARVLLGLGIGVAHEVHALLRGRGPRP